MRSVFLFFLFLGITLPSPAYCAPVDLPQARPSLLQSVQFSSHQSPPSPYDANTSLLALKSQETEAILTLPRSLPDSGSYLGKVLSDSLQTHTLFTKSGSDSLPIHQELLSNSKRGVGGIPYPFRSLNLTKGLLASLSMGPTQLSGRELDNAFLLQWEGELSFFYKPNISGGGTFKITAGAPSDSTFEVENRYLIFSRWHWRHNKLAFFVGPMFGVHIFDYQINLGKDSTDKPDNVGAGQTIKNIDDQNFIYAIEMGSGYLLQNSWGVFGGLKMEHSWQREFLGRFSGGVAYDFNQLVKPQNRVAQAFFFHLEYQFTLVDDQSFPARSSESNWYFGISIGL